MPDRLARRVRAADRDPRQSPSCLEAETFFETVAKGSRSKEITTSGIFGKPKLGRIFAGRSASGRFFADDLFAPCENGGRGGDPSYCENVPIDPATGARAEDRVVMDEVVRTVRRGVPADGVRKRPNLTFVNFPGHRGGTGPAYDAALSRADDAIERFVNNQKQLGLWTRTTMIVLSDHSMDTTPQKTSLTRCYDAAGIDSDDYVVVQNGSAALIYLADRTDPGRFQLLKRLRAASLRCGLGGVGELGAKIGLSGTNEANYRERNPVDGGDAQTLGRVHPAYRLVDRRAGDLVVTHDPGGAFSEPVNPLAGNHGSPFTRDNFFAVIGGGDFVRQQTLRGVRGPRFDDTLRNPRQAENVDVAVTALCALGQP
nr:alkaline phosphatase family protein [Actinomycetota bacterium]